MCTRSNLTQNISPSHIRLLRHFLAHMVDFHNPAAIEEDFLAVVKFWHFLDGIFIWEFVVTLDYEWSVIRGHRPYRWTIWIYSLTRVFTLIAVIFHMVGLDSSSPINCQLWVIFLATFSYLAFAAASILIVIRIIAIWDRNRVAVAIAMGAWSTNVAFLIHSVTILHSEWAPAQSVCGVLNTESSKLNVVSVLVSDVVLLLTMLVGLLRMRRSGTMFSLGKLLWKQGLIWLLLATVAEVPPAVFISLNLNDPLNLMFQAPALVGMSIAATRIYRSLTEFTDSGRSPFDANPTPREPMAKTDPKRIFAVQLPPTRVEVAVRRSSEDSAPINVGRYESFGPDCVDIQSQNSVQSIGNPPDVERG
ncbi:hypothetical protein EI94DRAFT_1746440 [Lactarius quietus]|nr:hypothetical protein EI94DRAFT_1746440 [Lactarius quietus]